MKNKLFKLLSLALFSLVILTGVGSATVTVNSGDFQVFTPSSVNHDSSFPITIQLTNSGDTNGNVLVTNSITSPSGATITGNVATNVSVDVGVPKNITATITIPAHSSGIITGSIKVQDDGVAATKLFEININQSKTLSLTKVSDLTLKQNASIKLKNTGNQPLTISLSDSGDFPVAFSSDSVTLNAGVESGTISVFPDLIVKPTLFDDLKFGTNSVTVNASVSGAVSQTLALTLSKTFCQSGSAGNKLKIRSFDINSEGDEDDEWKPLDEVKIEIDVENLDNENSVKEVKVELGLFDGSGINRINDLDFVSSDEEEVDLGSIKHDDKETATFEFIVPADFDEGDYKLAVKAFSDDLGETNQCVDSSDVDLSDKIFHRISADKETDEGKFIAFNNIKISPETAVCGDTVKLDAEVHNVGDEDQDQVKVTLFNKELKINTFAEIKSDLDQGEDADVSFTFDIPRDAVDKTYNLELNAEYDYRNDLYRMSSDEVTKIFYQVIGCSTIPTPTSGNIALITASLISEAKVGEDLKIKTTIVNTGTETKNYAVDVKGFSTWGELKSVSSGVVTLTAGESKDVEIVFTPSESAEGEESFTLELTANEKTQTKEIAVNIEGKAKTTSVFGDNKVIWIIGIVNLILIIFIIIVAVRISSR